MKCDYCSGGPFENRADCDKCHGTGVIEWWKSKAYRDNPDQLPNEREASLNRDDGYAHLGIICGVLGGLYCFFLTASSGLSLAVGVGVMILSAIILRFIGRNFLILAITGYVLYQIFG